MLKLRYHRESRTYVPHMKRKLQPSTSSHEATTTHRSGTVNFLVPRLSNRFSMCMCERLCAAHGDSSRPSFPRRCPWRRRVPLAPLYKIAWSTVAYTFVGIFGGIWEHRRTSESHSSEGKEFIFWLEKKSNLYTYLARWSKDKIHKVTSMRPPIYTFSFLPFRFVFLSSFYFLSLFRRSRCASVPWNAVTQVRIFNVLTGPKHATRKR